MERWEQDAIERRIDRLEEAGRKTAEAGRKTEDKFRELEWRDGMRIHLNMMVLFWILMGALVVLEIAMAAVKG